MSNLYKILPDKFIVTPGSYTQEEWSKLYIKAVEYCYKQQEIINKAIEYIRKIQDSNINNDLSGDEVGTIVDILRGDIGEQNL